MGFWSTQSPRCSAVAESCTLGRVLSLLYFSYTHAIPRSTWARFAFTPLQCTVATVRPYLSISWTSNVASFPQHRSDNDCRDLVPNGCLRSGASMFASLILSGLLSTKMDSVSPSVMLMTWCENAGKCSDMSKGAHFNLQHRFNRGSTTHRSGRQHILQRQKSRVLRMWTALPRYKKRFRQVSARRQ